MVGAAFRNGGGLRAAGVVVPGWLGAVKEK